MPRLLIKLRPQNDVVVLSLNYQQYLQAALYNLIRDQRFASFLHELGFQKEKRSFKLFTFSRLSGLYTVRARDKKIEFSGTLVWQISSILGELIQQLGDSLLVDGQIVLAGQVLIVEEVILTRADVVEDNCRIRTLSPITVYSTFESNEKKVTHYFQPADLAFPTLVENNLKNKYEAYYGSTPDTAFQIKPVLGVKLHKVVTSFKGHMITGWMGTFDVQSTKEQIQFAYECGIGARNSQGFGMFDILGN